MLRGALIVVAAVVALAALGVQALADGLYGALATPHSLPHHLAGDWPFAVAEKTGLDRIGVVRVMLARGAIVRNEPARAVALLAPLGDSPDIADLRGRAALAAGDAASALRDLAAAGDFVTASSAIDALGQTDPRAALAVVHDLEARLAARASGPEIAAEAAWREGVIAAIAATRYPAAAADYDRESADAFARALARAPNEEKYLLNYAFAALRIGDATNARTAYARAAQVVPDSVDAFVGVAVSAAVLGDCATARTAFAQAKGFAAGQQRNADPVAAGYAAPAIAAFTRCNG